MNEITVPLFKRKEIVAYAKVDEQDLHKVAHYRWVFHRGYAQTTSGQKTIMMHRIIADAKEGDITDHINGNKIDNRKANLRLVTSKQNSWNRQIGIRNTSGFKGVWTGGRKNPNRWRAAIQKDGKYQHLGYFATPEEAARAYDSAAIKTYGDFASLNGGKLLV